MKEKIKTICVIILFLFFLSFLGYSLFHFFHFFGAQIVGDVKEIVIKFLNWKRWDWKGWEPISAIALIITSFLIFLQARSTKKLADYTVKKEIIKAEIEDIRIKKFDQDISQDIFDDPNYEFVGISGMPGGKVKERYEDFKKPIEFFIVTFKITNTSNFTWKNPTFTYETPVSQRYLNKDHPPIIREQLPHTNPHTTSPSYYFLSGDTDIFTLTNLPYINSGKPLIIEFTLFLDLEMEEFAINMSVNCEKAEGVTKPIKIKPRELLEKRESWEQFKH